jgi:hypothetical protein
MVSATTAAAADPEAGSSKVHGSGMASVERMPEVMRVQVQLVAKKPTLADALAALAERREAVKGVLPTLGAAAESITIETPQVTDGAAVMKNYAELTARMGRTKRGNKGAAPTLPTTATAVLTVEWPLTAADAEELIKVAHEIQAKVKEADLGGAKDAAKRTPEEEELLAEMEEMSSYSSNEKRPLGEPVFSFVAKIDAKEKARLTAEAFDKAKTDAGEVAEAAGGMLGRAMSVHRAAVMHPMGHGYSMHMGNPFGGGMYDEYGSGGGVIPAADNEATSPTPAKVKYAVQVEADFHVEFPTP